MLFKGDLHQLCDYISNITNPYTCLMVWRWHHFLLASNTRITPDRLCQIMLNWKLSHKFENWHEFSRCVRVKSQKNETCLYVVEHKYIYSLYSTSFCWKSLHTFISWDFFLLVSLTWDSMLTQQYCWRFQVFWDVMLCHCIKSSLGISCF